MKKVILSLFIVFGFVANGSAAGSAGYYPSCSMDQFPLKGEETFEDLTSEFLDSTVDHEVKLTVLEALAKLITSEREAFNERGDIEYQTNDEFLRACTYTITTKIEVEAPIACEMEYVHVGMDRQRSFQRCWEKWTPWVRDSGAEKREITFEAQLIG